MAQPKKKESQASPVGHAMIGDTLGISILQCDLLRKYKAYTKKPLGCREQDLVQKPL